MKTISLNQKQRRESIEAEPEAEIITLSGLRVLIAKEPPFGAEIARACRYDKSRLAHLCRCSVEQLEGVFREFQWTAYGWLLEHKLLEDLQILEALEAQDRLHSIKNVAIERGYLNADEFDQAFKSRFGLPPRDFLEVRREALRKVGIDLTRRQAGSGSYPFIDL